MVGLVAVFFIRLLPLPWPEVIDTVLWVISLIASVYVLAAAACIVASRFTPYISGGMTTHRPSRCFRPSPVCSSTPTSASAT